MFTRSSRLHSSAVLINYGMIFLRRECSTETMLEPPPMFCSLTLATIDSENPCVIGELCQMCSEAVFKATLQ